jgi:hypothetical protein
VAWSDPHGSGRGLGEIQGGLLPPWGPGAPSLYHCHLNQPEELPREDKVDITESQMKAILDKVEATVNKVVAKVLEESGKPAAEVSRQVSITESAADVSDEQLVKLFMGLGLSERGAKRAVTGA